MPTVDHPESTEHPLHPAGDQPVRPAALRGAVQARHLHRRRQRRLLHPGRRPRPEPGRRQHQRSRARRGRLVPAATPPRTSGAPPRTCRSPCPPGGPWTAGRCRRRRRTGGCTCAARRTRSSSGTAGGWSSGGLMADTRSTARSSPARSSSGTRATASSAAGPARSGTWSSSGVNGAPAPSFPNPPHTAIGQTPQVREKPFLYVDGTGELPGLRAGAADQLDRHQLVRARPRPARRSRCRQFYVVQPGATAATINAALAQGRHLLFTPGVYHVTETDPGQPRRHRRPRPRPGHHPVPTTAASAMRVADVDGVKVAGLLFDAGTTNSPVLMEVGPAGSSASHAAQPDLAARRVLPHRRRRTSARPPTR